MRPRAQLPLVRRLLRWVVQQSQSADRVVGNERDEDVVAVGEALGEDLHDGARQREHGRVVRLRGVLER